MTVEPTDDADRANYTGCEPFGPGDDYDPMYEGPGGAPKCARESNDWRGCSCDHEGRRIPGHHGCRHCNPPDHENKPCGWGVETFDSPAWADARRHFLAVWRSVTGRFDAHPMDWTRLIRKWAEAGGWDEALWKASERLWDRLCADCQTHAEAKAKYVKWVEKRTRTRGKR